MSYAYIVDGAVAAESDHLPYAVPYANSRAWIREFHLAPVETQQALGWFAIADTPRPPDSDTATYVRSVDLVDGAPIVAWKSRPPAPEEIAARNAAAIRDRLALAIKSNHAYLNAASPTNAQTLAQVKAMTRQLSGLIRLTLGHLDGTD